MQHSRKKSITRCFPISSHLFVPILLLSFLSQVGLTAGVETSCNTRLLYDYTPGGVTDTTVGNVFTSCSLNSTKYHAPPSGDGITLRGSTAASANLATGKLRSVSTGEIYNEEPGIVAGGRNMASITDTVTVLGDLTGGVKIDVVLNVEGSFTGTSDGLQMHAQLWDLIGPYSTQANAGASTSYDVGTTASGFGDWDVDFISDQPGNVEVLLAISFLVTPENNDFTFRALLATECCVASPHYASGVASADFGNTARLGIIMPEGYSFTSESGALLSEVPLPPTAWLFLSAIGGLGWIKRKKA